MSDSTVEMVFVGDVYIKRDDPPSMLTSVRSVLRDADISFGNLEGPITDRGEPLLGKPIAGVHFQSPLNTVTALSDGVFDVMSLANNHSMDLGPEGIMQTVEVLDEANIQHCGAGADDAAARMPAIISRGGSRFAFLSYSSVFQPGAFPATADRPGIATVRVHTAYQPSPRVFEQPGSPAIPVTTADEVDHETLMADVRQARDVADFVIVSWHWGISQSYRKIADYQVDLGRAVIDAGANLVIGHHPHVLQGIEFHGDGLICYSLGNFAFDRESPHFDSETAILTCRVVNGEIDRVTVIPVLINDSHEPEIVEGDRAGAVLDLVERESAPFNTSVIRKNGIAVLQPAAAPAT